VRVRVAWLSAVFGEGVVLATRLQGWKLSNASQISYSYRHWPGFLPGVRGDVSGPLPERVSDSKSDARLEV